MEKGNFTDNYEPNDPGLRGFPRPELSEADRRLVEEYDNANLFPGEVEDYETVEKELTPEDILESHLMITPDMVDEATRGRINKTRGNLAYWPPSSPNDNPLPTARWEMFDNGMAAEAIRRNPLDGSRIVLGLINHNFDNQKSNLN